MRPNRLQNALAALSDAIGEVNAAIEEMREEHDPLAVHIFVSRRNYQNVRDTKSSKRSDTAARLSWQSACELGFRGGPVRMGTTNECRAQAINAFPNAALRRS